MSDDPSFSVAELAEYCETQAGLLMGRTETIAAEADALLDEIDDDIAEIRSRLAAQTDGPETPDAAPATAGPDDVAELEALESDLEEKQAVVEAKRARMDAFQELSEAYAELATDLEECDDGREALQRVLRFESEHDAPAYFDERLTILEAAASEE